MGYIGHTPYNAHINTYLRDYMGLRGVSEVMLVAGSRDPWFRDRFGVSVGVSVVGGGR